MLAIHLLDHQIVYFDKHQNLRKLDAKKTETTLTAWLKINETNTECSNILYHDFPKYYTWNINKKQWAKRKFNETTTLGSVYIVHPREGEKYYLRMLLYIVP